MSVENEQKQEGATSPLVLNVIGEVAPSGQAISLRIERNEQEPINLRIRADDVKALVGLLIGLGHEAKRRQIPKGALAFPEEAIPLLPDAIDVGQFHDDQTFLLLDAGITPLIVVLPRQWWEQIGQSILLHSAEVSSSRS